MPASSLRPLSTILCSLQPWPKRRALSTSGDTTAFRPTQPELATAPAPRTADTLTLDDSSPTLVGKEDMPIATPDNESNIPSMHAYARAPGPDGTSNGVPVSGAKGHERADTPQVFSSIPARHAIGDGARLPMPAPKPTRFVSVNHHASRSHSGAPSQSPPHHQGPSSPMRRARTNSNDRVTGGGGATALWAPSVLSDSEFNSPFTDPEASRNSRYQSQNNEVRPAMAQPPPSWNPHQSSQFSEFIIGNDGMMKVRPIPNSNNNVNNHNKNNHTQHQHRQAQDVHHDNRLSLEDPFEPHPAHKTKLPVRDAHARNPYSEHPSHPIKSLVDDDEIRGAIPSSFETPRGLDRPKQEPSNRQNQVFGGIDEDDDEDFDTLSEPEHPTPRGPERRPAKHELLESPLPPRHLSPFKADRGTKRRWHSCDYDDKALSSMSYADLQGQPFDFDPTAEAPSPPVNRVAEGNTLPARLEHYKAKHEADQKAFFEEMSVADWDGAGDWFLDQFGALMHKMRENRRQRRAVVDRFEREIADREEGVRMRTEAVHKKLDKMKQNGLRVVTDGDDI